MSGSGSKPESRLQCSSTGRLLPHRQGICGATAINAACKALQQLQLVSEQHVSSEPYCRMLSVIWPPQNAYRSLPVAFSSLVPISSLQVKGPT